MRTLEREIRQIVRDHDRLGRARERIIHSPTTGHSIYAAHERDHHITTAGRMALSRSLFALPPGPEEARRGIAGRVPFDTIRRARSGLARLSMMRHRGTISQADLERGRRWILERWPSIHGTR